MHSSIKKIDNRKQKGSVLLVALVLVLVSALLGVSAMQSSRLESQLTNNVRFEQTTFRTAEAAAESLLTTDNIFFLANNLDDTVSSIQSIESAVNVEAYFELLGVAPAIGYSLGGSNGFQNINFKATSVATIKSVNSAKKIIVGVKRLAVADI